MTGIDCIISTPDDERKICLLRICSYAISNEVDFFTALSALELEDEFRIFDYKERNFEYEEWLHNPTHPRELISIFRRCLVSIEKDSADIDWFKHWQISYLRSASSSNDCEHIYNDVPMKTRKRYRPSPLPLIIALLSLQLLNVGHSRQQAIAQKNSDPQQTEISRKSEIENDKTQFKGSK